MSGDKNEPNKDGNQTAEPTSDGGGEFKAITSQEDFEARLKDRLARERSKYADYDDLKAKADKLAQLEDADKTEQQKLADKLAKAEEAKAKAEADALRFKVAAEHQVSNEDAELFLTGTDEETLTKQAKRLTERADHQKKSGNVVPREGSVTEPKEDEMREFTRQLFEGARAQ